ncbi:hypothetical protein [Elizabethkingia miricola]|uniref:Uncharacterized protein n=1 Tax=Elizabethkingia miricola TaxID=172045 RepID=A0ABD5B4J1_ELIMR|nr:hypothetical protein [Elizabethkingia miricola]MDQ8748338.1 hypothetical protein [Elizabethkingia miricola]
MEMEYNFDILYRMHAKNEQFYKLGYILKNEYVSNNIIILRELKHFRLTSTQLKIIKEAVIDEFSIIKFRLGIQSLEIEVKN